MQVGLTVVRYNLGTFWHYKGISLSNGMIYQHSEGDEYITRYNFNREFKVGSSISDLYFKNL